MKTSKNALNIVCAGIMQSWRKTGLGSYVRYTELTPTKSGIVGMISCALGYPRNDNRIKLLNEKIELFLNVEESGSLCPDSDNKIPDIMMDFQTISAPEMKKAGGGTMDTPSIIEKEYILAYRFSLYIVSDDETLNQIKLALENPVWPYYLGSKNCIPSEPVCRDIIKNIDLEDKSYVYQHIRV